MSNRSDTTFRFLNNDGVWKDFAWDGLELHPDGSLTLATLPKIVDALPADMSQLPPAGPAGIAVACDGRIFQSDPSAHRILAFDPCDSAIRDLPCFGQFGDRPNQLNQPRGLAIHKTLNVLLIADSGNGRIMLIDLETYQLRGIWDGRASGQFHRPISLAVDSLGYVYIVDQGDSLAQPPIYPKVVKMDQWGSAIDEFWDNVQASNLIESPVNVAVVTDAVDQSESGEVFVLDRKATSLFVVDKSGNVVGSFPIAEPQNVDPLGLYVANSSIFIGDNLGRRLLKYRIGNPRAIEAPATDLFLVGAAFGYEGPIAAIAGDSSGNLFLKPFDAGDVIKFDATSAYAMQGLMVGGPVSIGSEPVQWQRLSALFAQRDRDAHFQFFVLATERKLQIGDINWKDHLLARQPLSGLTTQDSWIVIPEDIDDFLLCQRTKNVWIAATLVGNGLVSPCLEQLKVNFDQDSYLKRLPATYQKHAKHVEPLERFLRLFQSVFDDAEQQIGRLDEYFDAEAVEADWLDWLAGWLAVPLDQRWSEAKRRAAILAAYNASARRGTSRGLREAIRFNLDLETHIEEPLFNADWWMLTEEPNEDDCTSVAGSALGFDTRLAGSHPQGAVVGSSTILDQSQLITNDQYGQPLFNETAHRFTVYLYRSQIRNPNTLQDVKRLIEVEKPAHTTYQICWIESEMRIGFQSIIGVDTVIAGDPGKPSRLGVSNQKDPTTTLGGHPPGRIGSGSTVGKTAWLNSEVDVACCTIDESSPEQPTQNMEKLNDQKTPC